MTIPINPFEDVLDLLERDLALRDQLRCRILTQELLQLPAQFLLLRIAMDELIDRVGNLEA